ncbi:MAG TPA: lamin tail domain-containing protein, partial [Pedobacter sp.]
YLINNGGGKPARVQLTRSFTEADLIFNTPLTRGNTYHVSGTNIRDCAGLALLSSNNFAEFFYPSKIERGDVLISEILFNPRLGGVDFVEIYNNTSKVFDLKELSIATIKAPDSLVSKKSLSAAPILFNPKQYMVLTTDPDNIKKEYHTENPDAFLKLPSMPAFNNDKGSVVLISKENRIDQFNYTEKMHLKLIKDPKGVSLERSSFTNATNEPGNFRSAASTVGYATPGYNNSQAMTGDREHNQEVALLSKTFSPDGDGFEDALQLNYHFQDAGMIANATIYNDRGILIKHLAKNATLAINGTLVWDGLNNNDQKASVGVYIVYLEVFNLQGVVKKYRKACVLATKLN